MSKPDQVFHLRPEGEKMYGFAAGVKVGNMLYLSGAIAMDDQFQTVAPGDMVGQLRAVYADIEKVLAVHGASFANVVKETSYVTDMDAFLAPEANAVRVAHYRDCAPPAATVVQVARLAFPDNLVEIEAVAVLESP